MRLKIGLISAAVFAGIVATGCTSTVTTPTHGATATRSAPPQTIPPVQNKASQALEVYYTKVQNELLSRGLLRVDGGGPDTPITAPMLARNFERIALHEEYAMVGRRMVARQTPSHLHRWEDPVRVKLEFGPSVAPEKKAVDRSRMSGLVRRIAHATGHPMYEVNDSANFHVFVVNEHERLSLVPRLQQIMPQIGLATLEAVTRMPRSSYCLVFAYDPGDQGVYRQAVAVIRAEHPDLMRLSCLHEEIAQGMGLSNDSPAARPSVFNDDEEFGLLTRHDDLLLRMLYDRRLRPGMTPEEAEPIVRQIAEELVHRAG